MLLPLVFAPSYNTDLTAFGLNKPFALDRGELVITKLKEELPTLEHHPPVSFTYEELLTVHTPEYLDSLTQDRTWQDIFELKENEYRPENAKLPLHKIIDDFMLKGGGTKVAFDLALKHGLAANLGGGYHHAFPDRGRGYCSIHDIGITIKLAQNAAKVKSVLIVDLDFHQGDGSAVIFSGDNSVFTFSVHSREGWPELKQNSDLDVAISQSEQHLYLEKTADGLKKVLRRFSPDAVLFVAGSDPYEKDVLPGSNFINLPLSVMRERDHLVIDTFADLGIPLCKVFAGGYGSHVWEVHYLATRRLLQRTGHLQ